MHRRRGGEARKRGIRHRGVTPATDQYPSLAAGFRRRALFFEKPPDANIRAPANSSGHFASSAWTLAWIQAPTSPGPWERTIKTTMPTGLAVSRGQFRLPAQGLTMSKQVPHGPSLDAPNNASIIVRTTG